MEGLTWRSTKQVFFVRSVLYSGLQERFGWFHQVNMNTVCDCIYTGLCQYLNFCSLTLCLYTVIFHLPAVCHWPQTGGLANCHEQPQGSCDHCGAAGVCHPSCWHLLGVGPPCQLLFLTSDLYLQQPRRGADEHWVVVIYADVPSLVLGAQNHPSAQQSAAERILQDHRLAQQNKLQLPLFTQDNDAQIPGAHAAGLHPLLLAYSLLDAYFVWEVGGDICVEYQDYLQKKLDDIYCILTL